MIRSTTLVLGLLLTACAADAALDPMDEPGAAGSGAFAGSSSVLAGAGTPVAPYMAGSAAPIVAGSGEQPVAGTGAAAGNVAVAGAGGSAAGTTAQAGGAGGSVAVAGHGAAGSAGAAGTTAQAGAGGAPAPVVHELWTITQSNEMAGGTVVTTVNDPQNLTVRLEPSGAGSVPATTLLWTFGRNDTVDQVFSAVERSPGAATTEAAYIACAAFRSYWHTTGADVTGPVTPETPAHITYVRLVASSKLTGRTEAWLLTVSLSWTAYGY